DCGGASLLQRPAGRPHARQVAHDAVPGDHRREFPAVRIRGRLIVPAKAIEAMVDAAIADQTVIDASGWVSREAVLR
ncbi:MAG: hypothetical protein LC799_13470, partial [Actinobacteria bacterium]|nr:hypothetical protein [Actinomycetota bacterium]